MVNDSTKKTNDHFSHQFTEHEKGHDIWTYNVWKLTLREYLASLWVRGGVRIVHLFSFLCCVVFVFVLCIVCPNLSTTYLAIFTNFICICVRSLSRDVKNSCNLLQRQSYIRNKCLSIFTRPTWTNYISPLSRRQTYCLSRIASPYDSSSYTHTIMFYLFIFWHRLIISRV